MIEKSKHKLAVWDESKKAYVQTYKCEDGKRGVYLEAGYYRSMKTRCTSEIYKSLYPTYTTVSMSSDMEDYSVFVEWCRKQIGFDNSGWVLDKDILDPSNKVYSQDTCVFVPSAVNAFFTFVKGSRKNGLPFGVSWCESESAYKAYCSQLNGKNKTLGRFSTPELAG